MDSLVSKEHHKKKRGLGLSVPSCSTFVLIGLVEWLNKLRGQTVLTIKIQMEFIRRWKKR